MPILVQRLNDLIVDKIEIPQKGLSIGRSVKNDVYLDDPSTSQIHSKIETKELKDGNLIYFISDLNSTNQTFVNGNSIKEHLLCDQDVIEIGVNQFKFVDENEESLAATQQFKKSWIPGILILR
ncbi:MAG: FHA domain-containing protein [Kangiellaceae bacterium]|nr:FHA domain-containing protein [Kangiellaceae bacterium]